MLQVFTTNKQQSLNYFEFVPTDIYVDLGSVLKIGTEEVGIRMKTSLTVTLILWTL
jgi:hypothetical protein